MSAVFNDDANAPTVKAVRPATASKVTGLSERTIYRMCASGQLRTVKVGRATLIPMSSIDALLAGGGDVRTA